MIKIYVAVLILLFTSCSYSEHYNWESVFFHAINGLTYKQKLKSLRNSNLPEYSVEIRIWSGFGVACNQGIILRKEKDNYTGFYIIPDCKDNMVQLKPPRSGWKKLWIELENSGIYKFEDECETDPMFMVQDGTTYIFETLKSNKYRTFMCSNPGYLKCEEAKKVLKIVSILENEFIEL